MTVQMLVEAHSTEVARFITAIRVRVTQLIAVTTIWPVDPACRSDIGRLRTGTQMPPRRRPSAIVKAKPLEDQLVAWLHPFQPDATLRDLVLDTIRSATQQHPGAAQERRRELLTVGSTEGLTGNAG
jgi:hypothetical protein